MVDMKKKKYQQWYRKVGLKHVTGFLTADEKQKMKRLAEAADKSLSRYVTRLMQQHIRDNEVKVIGKSLDDQHQEQKGRTEKDGRVRIDGDGTQRS